MKFLYDNLTREINVLHVYAHMIHTQTLDLSAAPYCISTLGLTATQK